MPDRQPRYSEKDAQAIFARAADKQRREAPGPDGLSLSELEEIGRVAGLDPALIRTAAAELSTVETSPPAKFLGQEIEAIAERIVPGEISDEMWGRMISELRRNAGNSGVAGGFGRTREWVSTASRTEAPLIATLTPVDGGTRITVEQSFGSQTNGLKALPFIFGGISLFFVALLLAGSPEPAMWALPVGLASFPLVILLILRFTLGFKKSRADRSHERLLDRLELIARSGDVSQPAPTPVAAGGRIELPEDDEMSEPEKSPDTRSRVR
ncbi:hypothetical protein BH23BAC4_BH23BAC4_08490 [soil metagenome]